jgi:hypothetical protein
MLHEKLKTQYFEAGAADQAIGSLSGTKTYRADISAEMKAQV